MKKNEKGFTLIELLAVIIILAIIALIAVPTITSIIENSKKSAAEDSAYGMISASELWHSNTALVNNGVVPTVSVAASGAVTVTGGGTLPTGAETAIKFKGTKPDSVTTWTISNDGVIAFEAVIKGYTCTYDGSTSKVTCSDSSGD